MVADPTPTSVALYDTDIQPVTRHSIPRSRPTDQSAAIQPVRFDRHNINLPGEVFPHRRFRARAPLSSTVVPYTADVYITKDRPDGYLDANRFALLSSTSSTSGRHVRSRSEAWTHRWRHWGGRGAHGNPSVGGTLVDMPFVRCFEERTYQASLFTLLSSHRNDRLTEDAVFPIHDVSLYLIAFEDPFDRLPFIARAVFWAEDCNSEERVRSNQKYFAGWQNFEIHDVLPEHRSKAYATVPNDWPVVSSLLAVPNPAALSYHSRDWISGTPVEKNNINWVARSEFALYSFFRFLSIAREGCSFYHRTKDPRFLSTFYPSCKGRLVELPGVISDQIHKLGVYECLDGSSFDPGCAVLALHQMTNVRYRSGGAGFYPYEWDSGVVRPMDSVTDADRRVLPGETVSWLARSPSVIECRTVAHRWYRDHPSYNCPNGLPDSATDSPPLPPVVRFDPVVPQSSYDGSHVFGRSDHDPYRGVDPYGMGVVQPPSTRPAPSYFNMPVVDDPLSTDERVSVAVLNRTVAEIGAVCESVGVARPTSLLELLALAPQWARDSGTLRRLERESALRSSASKRPRYQ